jgi:hypothetical protein
MLGAQQRQHGTGAGDEVRQADHAPAVNRLENLTDLESHGCSFRVGGRVAFPTIRNIGPWIAYPTKVCSPAARSAVFHAPFSLAQYVVRYWHASQVAPAAQLTRRPAARRRFDKGCCCDVGHVGRLPEISASAPTGGGSLRCSGLAPRWPSLCGGTAIPGGIRAGGGPFGTRSPA